MKASLRARLPRAGWALALGTALLAGCSSGTSATNSPSPHDTSPTAASTVVMPQRIIAVTSETADMALLLAGPDSMAGIAAGSQSPAMGMVPQLAQQVENTLPAGINPDAEQILSYQPDLVLTTSRHGGEKSAAEQLAAAGVPMIAFESADFGTPEAYAEALLKVGEAVGQQSAAEDYADRLRESIAEIDAQKSDQQPSVLVLMARGGNVMAMASDNMLPGLALRAGATDAAAAAGITSTGAIDAETLVRADPDIILLENFQGAGEEPFDELLSGTAVAEVPAIATHDVHLIEMTEASSVAGINLPTGYQKIMDIISK